MDIWYADLSKFNGNPIAPGVLSQEEISKGERFHLQAKRDNYYQAKSITRLLASRYLNIRAGSIAIHATRQGKPYFEGKDRIHFNTSHSANMFVIAFSDAPVGVDIELVRELTDLKSVASNVFSLAEHTHFAGLVPAEQSKYFFKLWCIKESFLKLTGSGLSGEPKEIAISEHDDLFNKKTLEVRYKGSRAYGTFLNLDRSNFECFVCSGDRIQHLALHEATPTSVYQ